LAKDQHIKPSLSQIMDRRGHIWFFIWPCLKIFLVPLSLKTTQNNPTSPMAQSKIFFTNNKIVKFWIKAKKISFLCAFKGTRWTPGTRKCRVSIKGAYSLLSCLNRGVCSSFYSLYLVSSSSFYWSRSKSHY